MKTRKDLSITLFSVVLLVTIGYEYTDSSSDKNNQNTANETGTVTDVEGNVYKTVKIGNQWWMAENLRATKYRNGDSIPNVTDNSVWATLNTPAYCWYENDSTAYETTYGVLYNWFTVDNTSNGNRSICPEDWHIPSNEEILSLINTLNGLTEAGSKMKEAGTSHWSPPNTGATNTSGFTALPGGYRSYTDGKFKYKGDFGHWWTSTQSDENQAWNLGLFYLDASVDNSASVKQLGFSIRCVKD